MLKIATWNINSLRIRLPHVLGWLKTHQPDILALQELKLPTEEFPLAEIQQAGYQAMVSGQRTYNGVAILSRRDGQEIITDIPGLEDTQRRIISLTLEDMQIINLYVPNGESVVSDKYLYKLDWLKKMTHYLQQQLLANKRLIVLGDFNIAPENQDVHNPLMWEGQVLFSQPERDAFQSLLKMGLRDCFRLFTQPEKSFTWWDYRMGAYRRNMGLRIDHILASESLAKLCKQCYIDKTPRGGERPSDHVPVVAEFDI